jgi:hypothetical protein
MGECQIADAVGTEYTRADVIPCNLKSYLRFKIARHAAFLVLTINIAAI